MAPMKPTTNFAPPVHDLVTGLVIGSVACAIAFLMISAWLVVDGFRLRSERIALHENAVQLDKKLAALPAETLPAQSDLVALRNRVARINELSGMRGWPLPVLLERLGAWLPNDAYLVRVAVRSSSGEVEMTVEAGRPEGLLQFLDALQKEPHFSEVLLTRQSQKEDRAGKRVQFELRLKERAG